MSRPTPGPWAANGLRVESENEHGWANDGWVIADCFGPDGADNARLVAAAPDLLAALSMTRAQWIHSVNADACLAALERAGFPQPPKPEGKQ